MSIDELEKVVSNLPPDEFERFSLWFDHYRQSRQEDDEWDRQMKADAEAGKFDDLIEEAEEDIAAGRTYPLP